MKRKRNRNEGLGRRPRIISLAELVLIHDQLEKAARPGTDPAEQAAVITWAAQYQGTYYYTRTNCLRRTFPKVTEVVLFHGVPQSPSAGAMLAAMKGSEDGQSDQP